MDPPVAGSPAPRGGSDAVPTTTDGPVLDSYTNPLLPSASESFDDDNLLRAQQQTATPPRLPASASDVMRGAGIRGSGFRVLEGSLNSSGTSSANTAASLLALKDEIARRWVAIAWALGFAAFVIPTAVPSVGERWAGDAAWYLLLGFDVLLGACFVGLHYHRERSRGDDDDEDATAAEDEDGGLEAAMAMLTTSTTPSEDDVDDDDDDEKSRVHFLDNAKTFLTLVVLLCNVSAGFGAGSDADMYAGGAPLVVGRFDNPWATVVRACLLEPSTRCVPCLFFFVSACFAPRSLRRKGRVRFLKERARRILSGALLVALGLGPLAEYWAARASGWTRGDGALNYAYRPWPGTTWFLWWLFLFDLWYACAADDADGRYRLPFSRHFKELPSSIPRRWGAAVLVCGALNKLVATYLLGGSTSIAYMPSSEFLNNALFFYVGLLAGENRWLDPSEGAPSPSISKQLGMNFWLFRAFVLLLYGGNVALSLGVLDPLPPAARFAIESVAHGLWTVEGSVVALEVFQKYADRRTPLSGWLARRSYGAYLLQNVLAYATPVAAFVYAYDAGRPEVPVEFAPGSVASSTVIPLAPLVVGWQYACLVYIPLCYVGAWVLGKLPGPKHVL